MQTSATTDHALVAINIMKEWLCLVITHMSITRQLGLLIMPYSKC